MATTLTSKGQVTIPKQIRDALNLAPGCSVDFSVNREGDVVIHKVGARPSRKPDRFESARGKADVKWRTDELMALLRSESEGLMLLVDTNVLVDVLENDPEWADWSIGQLRAQSKVHRLAINPIIYSELSLTFSTVEALDETIDELELAMIELPRPALFLAGKAFVRYRRQGGTKNNVLADFFIGAHAAVSRFPLLTRDTRRYRSCFPEVKLVAPEASP